MLVEQFGAQLIFEVGPLLIVVPVDLVTYKWPNNLTSGSLSSSLSLSTLECLQDICKMTHSQIVSCAPFCNVWSTT